MATTRSQKATIPVTKRQPSSGATSREPNPPPSARSSILATPQSVAAIVFDLDRLLSRLERNVLAEKTSDPALAHSAPLRRKICANIEYARTLVLRLEREAGDGAARSFPGGNARLRNDGNDFKPRVENAKLVIKRLNRRLLELDQLDISASPVDGAEELRQESADQPQKQPGTTSQADSTELRRRRPETEDEEKTNDTTSTQTTREALFSTSSSSPSNPSSAPAAATESSTQREVVLKSNKIEQEALTSSLLDIAKQLKASTNQFGALLEADKEVAARAEKGLDKNVSGLEAADRKMGTLRRMTEGKGWFARIRLYVILAAMWVAAFLLVFVGPKLRF